MGHDGGVALPVADQPALNCITADADELIADQQTLVLFDTDDVTRVGVNHGGVQHGGERIQEDLSFAEPAAWPVVALHRSLHTLNFGDESLPVDEADGHLHLGADLVLDDLGRRPAGEWLRTRRRSSGAS